MRSISVRMWAKFPVYGRHLYAPEALTIWAEYAIYGAIDKIPQICRGIWIYVEQNGLRWSKVECPITCILNYI